MLRRLLEGFARVPGAWLERAAATEQAIRQAYAGFGSYGIEPPKNTAEFVSLVEEQVVVYRCATLNAQGICSAAVKLFQGETEREEHPIAQLIADGNPEQSGRDVLELAVLDLELCGTAYLEIGRKDPKDTKGPALGLYRMHPGRTKIIPATATRPRSYRYEVNGRIIEIPDGNVICLRYPNPNNDWYGLGRLAAATATLVNSELQAEANNALLKNGAKPSGVYSFTDQVPYSEIDLFAEQWKGAFAGAANAGKTVFARGGEKYERLTMSPEELQSLEFLRWNREQIIHAFGINAFVYGISDGVSRDNAIVFRRQHFEQTIEPAGRRIAAQLTELGIPKLNLAKGEPRQWRIEFDYSQHPVNQELRAMAAVSNAVLMDRGVLTINEQREELGKDPVPYGDTWWGPASLVDVVAVNEAPPEQTDADATAPAAATVGALGGEQPDNQPSSEAGSPLPQGKDLRNQDTALNGAQVTAAAAIVAAVAFGDLPKDSAIGQLMVFFNLTREQAEAILGSVGDGFTPASSEPQAPNAPTPPEPTTPITQAKPEKKSTESPPRPKPSIVTRASGPIDEIAAAAEFEDDDPLLLQMERLFRQIVTEHGTEALLEIGVDATFNVNDKRVVKWLREKRITFVEQAFNKYSERVRAALVDGVNSGETEIQLAQRLNRIFEGRKANYQTVARTETVGSANFGRMDSYRQAELTEHTWITSRDEAVRDSHQALEGETVKIGEPFSNGLLFPGDTDHGDPSSFCNCRCDLVAVIPGASKSARAHSPGFLDSQWRAFDRRLLAGEKQVGKQFLRTVAEQERRTMAALAQNAGRL